MLAGMDKNLERMGGAGAAKEHTIQRHVLQRGSSNTDPSWCSRSGCSVVA